MIKLLTLLVLVLAPLDACVVHVAVTHRIYAVDVVLVASAWVITKLWPLAKT